MRLLLYSGAVVATPATANYVATAQPATATYGASIIVPAGNFVNYSALAQSATINYSTVVTPPADLAGYSVLARSATINYSVLATASPTSGGYAVSAQPAMVNYSTVVTSPVDLAGYSVSAQSATVNYSVLAIIPTLAGYSVKAQSATATYATSIFLADFSVLLGLSSLTIPYGGISTTIVTISPSNSYAKTVTPTISGLPAGIAGSFSPATIIGGSGTSTLTLTSTILGPTTVTISGTDGSLTHGANLIVSVASVAPAAADLRYGVVAGLITGTLHVPTPAQVLATIPVDASIGTVVQPLASQVQKSIAYGPGSTIIGTYDPTTGYTDPGIANVVLSTSYKFAGATFAGTYSSITIAQLQTALASGIVTLDLTQPLANVRTGTIGGAFHGAWAITWGNVVRSALNKIIRVFGFSSTTTPIATFAIDDGNSPTQRILQ